MGIYYAIVIFGFYITAAAGFPHIENEITSNVSSSVMNNSGAGADRNLTTSRENVTIDLHYECLCPASIGFFDESLMPVLKDIGQHITVNLYPYGFADTIEEDGVITFKCHHGPKECYGNKLHACALEILGNGPEGLKFISCLIRPPMRSNDAAADKCGKAMSVDTNPIKQCAKGTKGSELLKYYGEEKEKAEIDYVPWVIINDKVSKYEDDFYTNVCAAFKHPPAECEADDK